MPNPSSSEVRIDFCVDGLATRAQMQKIDESGRVVRQFDNVTTGQPDRIIWKGDDASACKVSAGMYFIRVSTDRGVVTESVVITR